MTIINGDVFDGLINPHTILRKKYGVSKSEMHSLLINAFHIPLEIATTACDKYFTRKWRASTCLPITEGMIRYQEQDYLVVYSNCTPFKLRKHEFAKFSFRVAKLEFNLPAYVLIKVIDENNEVQ